MNAGEFYGWLEKRHAPPSALRWVAFFAPETPVGELSKEPPHRADWFTWLAKELNTPESLRAKDVYSHTLRQAQIDAVARCAHPILRDPIYLRTSSKALKNFSAVIISILETKI